MIVYPMGLPPYDPVELEFKNQEELEGTQVCQNVEFDWTTNTMILQNENHFKQ